MLKRCENEMIVYKIKPKNSFIGKDAFVYFISPVDCNLVQLLVSLAITSNSFSNSLSGT